MVEKPMLEKPLLGRTTLPALFNTQTFVLRGAQTKIFVLRGAQTETFVLRGAQTKKIVLRGAQTTLPAQLTLPPSIFFPQRGLSIVGGAIDPGDLRASWNQMLHDPQASQEIENLINIYLLWVGEDIFMFLLPITLEGSTSFHSEAIRDTSSWGLQGSASGRRPTCRAPRRRSTPPRQSWWCWARGRVLPAAYPTSARRTAYTRWPAACRARLVCTIPPPRGAEGSVP